MLADNDPVVRMESGHLLAQIGSPSSAVALRDAIDRESDNGVRSSLQRDLLKLQPRGSN
jgi:HEAT repeat protein